VPIVHIGAMLGIAMLVLMCMVCVAISGTV
jgi:hypothetical protein